MPSEVPGPRPLDDEMDAVGSKRLAELPGVICNHAVIVLSTESSLFVWGIKVSPASWLIKGAVGPAWHTISGGGSVGGNVGADVIAAAD